MTALYKTLLLLHVLSALWMAASAFAGTVVRAQARRAADLAGRATAMRIGGRLVADFGLPGAIVAGLSGIGLILMNRPFLQMGFVHVSLTLWTILVSVNLFYSFPRLRRTLAEMERSAAAGAPTEELKRLTSAKLPAILADVNALAVVLFVVLMVLKPF
jgi:uncharacterized membrane protein